MTLIAIDFGTSNTVVCEQDPVTGQPRSPRQFAQISRAYETTQGQVQVVPSLLAVQGPHRILIGDPVRRDQIHLSQPERTFQGFKRDLAADFQSPPRQIDGEAYDAHRVAELFLTQIWQQVLDQGIQPSQVILTAPVGAFERYLDWYRDVAAALGMPKVQIVDEATAAALGYAVQRPGSVVLVVDFGGGTLDLSLVRTGTAEAGSAIQAEVIAKSDAYIGGMDVDQWLVETTLDTLGLGRASLSPTARTLLLEMAERIKIRLSSVPEAKESWFDDESFTAYDMAFTQAEMSQLLEEKDFLGQLRHTLDEVLSVAMAKGISKANLEQVLLVGGSCQIPAVQQLVTSYFGAAKVRLDKPFEAVAQGALQLGQRAAVQDYLRHSYAIRLWNPHAQIHEYLTLFHQGSTYPCQRPEPLRLQAAQEGQREVRLDIGEVGQSTQAEVFFDRGGRMSSRQFQGTIDYRSLDTQHQAVCVAHLNPPGRAGEDRIEVTFEVNAQRTLLANVRDLRSGQWLVYQGAVARLQ